MKLSEIFDPLIQLGMDKEEALKNRKAKLEKEIRILKAQKEINALETQKADLVIATARH